MFARHLSLHLKPNSVREFTDAVNQEVIPLLRNQKGFQDEITFVAPGGTEAVGISLWDQKENAEAYNRGTYPQVQNPLAKVVEGTPEIRTYEVANSTFHKIAARGSLRADSSFSVRIPLSLLCFSIPSYLWRLLARRSSAWTWLAL